MKPKTLTTLHPITAIILLILLISTACSTNETDPEDYALLTFSTPSTVKPVIAGELADITITASGGMLPYEFYVIPETQWQAGDQMHEMLIQNNFSRLYRYTYSKNFIGNLSCTVKVTPGTPTIPRYYWVSVQDKAENGVISGTNMLSWWKRVAVYDLAHK